MFQSLDVNLISGNINNITKFKLFLKHTRGNFEDEIFMTTLLSEMGYLAPRTKMVNVKLNGQNIEMIFQEKITKEFLEYNNRREGPILEGDEKYMMEYASKVKNNLGIDWYEIHNKFKLGKKIQLSKQTNSSWSIKNEKFIITSLIALSKLNQIYLEYLYNFSFDKNVYSILDYNMNNFLLSQNSEEHELKLNIFNNLILAANGHHMLYGNNRKFYWNSFEGYFEPIYYDGNLIINKKFGKLSPPFSSDYGVSLKKTKLLINKIDQNQFYEEILDKNLVINKKKVFLKFEKINQNLSIINKIFKEKKKKEFFNKNTLEYKKLVKNYIKNIKEQKKNIKLIKFKTNNENSKVSFLLCKKNNIQCTEKLELNDVNIRNLLEGNLASDGHDIQFFSNLNKTDSTYKKINLNNEYFDNVSFYFNDGVDFKFDKENKTFLISQKNQHGRAYFINGSIKDVLIKFNGEKKFFKEKKSNQYDYRTLTGCLSLIKLDIKNVKLISNNSNCEDGVNIINSTGKISEILSHNSLFDGIDIDFSNLKIENVNVKNSLNDCIDFSGGHYKIVNSNLSNCGDKGISVGEKSLLEIYKTNIFYANTGIASKDSSKTIVESSNISETKDCLAAYKKKQEFNGGMISIQNSICRNFKNKKVSDDFSLIQLNQEL